MILSQFLPAALPYLLIAGGLFLCYEGAEKVYEALTGGHHEDEDAPALQDGPEREKAMVSSAIRTDLILSAEIMVISLSSVEDEPFLTRLMVLIVVAILITILVYGVVAVIVKMDDVGLALAQRKSTLSQRIGRGLVAAMPKVMAVLTVVGIAAMLWVGGHILLVNVGEAGFHWPAAVCTTSSTGSANSCTALRRRPVVDRGNGGVRRRRTDPGRARRADRAPDFEAEEGHDGALRRYHRPRESIAAATPSAAVPGSRSPHLPSRVAARRGSLVRTPHRCRGERTGRACRAPRVSGS